MRQVSRYFAKYVLSSESLPHIEENARLLTTLKTSAVAEQAAHANLNRSYGVKLLSRERAFRHFRGAS